MNILSGNTEPHAEWKYCQTVISEQIDMWRERCGNHSNNTNTERVCVCVCVCENAASSRCVIVPEPPPTQFSCSTELSIWSINNFVSYANMFLNKTHLNKLLYPNHLDFGIIIRHRHMCLVIECIVSQKSSTPFGFTVHLCWLGSAHEIFISMTTQLPT